MPKPYAHQNTHPINTVIYFTLAVVLSFMTMQPVFLAISFFAVSLCLIFKDGISLYFKKLVAFVPMIILIALINSLFGYSGATVLFEFWIFKISAQSIVFGLASGLLLVAVIFWFDALSDRLDEEKMMYLCGGAFPNLAIMLSMIIHLVPDMQNKWKEIKDAQSSLAQNKVGEFVNSTTTLMETSLEESLITADSMNARGYGSAKRSSFMNYKWRSADTSSLVVILLLGAASFVIVLLPDASFSYYPYVSNFSLAWWFYLPIFAFFSLVLLGQKQNSRQEVLQNLRSVQAEKSASDIQEKGCVQSKTAATAEKYAPNRVTSTEPAVQIRDFSFAHTNSKQCVLSNINLDVMAGEFILLGGLSGSGKTTLLRELKPELSPKGERSGEIKLFGKPICELNQKESAETVGFLFQNPDAQIVTDKVWHEIVFGLECLGTKRTLMGARAESLAKTFGIEPWINRDTNKISGGQKQILNIASIEAMLPQVFLLDEPTAQLDLHATNKLLSMLKVLKEEKGATVLVAEHNLKPFANLADRVLWLENGKLRTVELEAELEAELGLNESQPNSSANAISNTGADTMTNANTSTNINSTSQISPNSYEEESKEILSLMNISFTYEKGEAEVIQNLNFKINRGKTHALLGNNGAGKTTLLKLILGALKPQIGDIYFNQNLLSQQDLAYIPQNPRMLFSRDSLIEEFKRIANIEEVQNILQEFDLNELRNHHPQDLSAGELQKASLAYAMLRKPKVLLLDEPFKGVDRVFKQKCAQTLREKVERGELLAIIIASHDLELVEELHAEKVAL